MTFAWLFQRSRSQRALGGMLAGVLVLVALTGSGCSSGWQGGSSSSSTGGVEVVKEVRLGSDWKMNQLRITVSADAETAVLLRLPDGGKVDGYFYLEKGSAVNFTVTGESLIYQSRPRAEGKSPSSASDRFSFVIDEATGTTCTMTFKNVAGDAKSGEMVVFVEVIYPASGFAFIPLGGE
jgi:hypothetical protein